jgi:hypothetical protein
MSRKTGNLNIVVSGAMVGIGLVAVAMAIFTRLPIGSEFLRVLREGSERQSGARMAAPRTYQSDRAVETKQRVPVEPEPEKPQKTGENKSEALPSSVTITSPTEVTMGIGKIALEIGNILPVSGMEDGMFLCDYLGDTVEVPVSATNWREPAEK